MAANLLKPAYQDERDRDIDAVGGREMGGQMRKQRIVVTGNEAATVRSAGIAFPPIQVVSPAGITCRTPPVGSGTSPAYLGMT